MWEVSVKSFSERHYCSVCGHRHSGGETCSPRVLAAIDAADKRAACIGCYSVADGSRDLSLGEAMLWLEELAERYPEEFAELV